MRSRDRRCFARRLFRSGKSAAAHPVRGCQQPSAASYRSGGPVGTGATHHRRVCRLLHNPLMRSRRRSWTSAGSEGSNSLIGRQSGAGTAGAFSRCGVRRSVMTKRPERCFGVGLLLEVALNAEDQIGEQCRRHSRQSRRTRPPPHVPGNSPLEGDLPAPF